jgi:hypothetical protein
MEKQKMKIAEQQPPPAKTQQPVATMETILEDAANEESQVLTSEELQATAAERHHRAFWIKLGRLAAMLEQLEESLAFLHAYQRSAWFRQLPEDLQKAISEHAGVIENIVHID